MYKIRHIFLSGLYIAIPSFITFFQPDLGSSIILVFLWVGILVLSGIKIKHFLILVLIGSLLLVVGWSFLLKDYQKSRIIGFLEPAADIQGSGWNLEQAKIAIGSGGIWGAGIGSGSQTRYGFLPEAKTDFIFAAIAEEMGFVGVSILFLLFFILVWRILRIIFQSTDNFSRIICSGFLIMVISQVFINIGMNQGLLPIVGIPLPLVSYGGSSLIFTFIGLGLIQSIYSKA
jgi:rod shape determining protein RodA